MADRLRSLTGCLRCRFRRYKCDERRPVCGPCRRIRARCLWASHSKASHILPIRRLLQDVLPAMHVQSRLADRELTRSWSLSQPAPARAISPGYPPLSSELEHHFMIHIDLMIHAFVWTEDTRTRRLQGYDVTIALQEPWIRNALFGVVSLRAAAMGLVPPDRPDQYYRAICEEIQHRKPGLSGRSGKEQLLVAVVWKALIEVRRCGPLPNHPLE